MQDDTTTTSAQRYHILINGQSGTVLQMGADSIAKCVQDNGLGESDLRFIAPEDFEHTITQLLNDSRLPILIGGGDGTIMRCAPLFLAYGRPMGIVPLGTMNLLARDLNIPVALDAAFTAYARGAQTHAIDVGMANDQMFLCCAALGMMPQATQFREENRGQHDALLLPRLTLFVFEQLDRMHRRHLTLRINGQKKRLRTPSLIVSNNQFALVNGRSENGFKKATLQGGTLGIYNAAPHSRWDKLRLMLRMGWGTWKQDRVIDEMTATEFMLHTRRAVETLSLDGENVEVKTPVRFWLRRQSLDMLVPTTHDSATEPVDLPDEAALAERNGSHAPHSFI